MHTGYSLDFLLNPTVRPVVAGGLERQEVRPTGAASEGPYRSHLKALVDRYHDEHNAWPDLWPLVVPDSYAWRHFLSTATEDALKRAVGQMRELLGDAMLDETRSGSPFLKGGPDVYWTSVEPTAEQLRSVRRALEKTLTLVPQLPPFAIVFDHHELLRRPEANGATWFRDDGFCVVMLRTAQEAGALLRTATHELWHVVDAPLFGRRSTTELEDRATMTAALLCGSRH